MCFGGEWDSVCREGLALCATHHALSIGVQRQLDSGSNRMVGNGEAAP